MKRGCLLRVASFTTLAAAIAGTASLPSPALAKKAFVPLRFTFTIDRQTPLRELLPIPPKLIAPSKAPWDREVLDVPEIEFGEPVPRDSKDAMRDTAHILAKINHLNAKDTDGFMKALLAEREDLRGLPFLLGDKAITLHEQARLARKVERAIRGVLLVANLPVLSQQSQEPVPQAASVINTKEGVWSNLRKKLSLDELRRDNSIDAPSSDVERTIVAAIMQMVTPISEIYGPELPKFLASIPQSDSAQALAKVAIFSPDAEVRKAAIAALKSRRHEEYTDVLLGAFRYPLPAAAQRASEALVALGRNDVVTRLLDVLDHPDPRAPHDQLANGRHQTVVRELVRINHHRNCALCHAPARAENTPRDIILGEVPMPDEPLSRPSESYGFGRSPDIMVRVDITYLRPDFSLVDRVKNSAPWRAEQRFDYFVRTRVVLADEAKEFDEHLEKGPQPYRQAALVALRALTGRDAGDSSRAWREMLSSP